MDKQYLNDEFNRFFEFPTEDKSHVSSVSAKLFVEHIAYPLEREIEQLRQRVAELEEERDEWRSKHDVSCLTITNLQSKYECQLSATSKAMQGVAELTAERDAMKQQRDDLLNTGSAVVERWDSPLWKDLPHTGEYIHRLREAIASVKEKA